MFNPSTIVSVFDGSHMRVGMVTQFMKRKYDQLLYYRVRFGGSEMFPCRVGKIMSHTHKREEGSSRGGEAGRHAEPPRELLAS